MSNTVPARAPHTAGLVTWLQAQTGKQVGRGEQPAGTGWQGAPGQSEFVPYYVLHPIPGGQLDGPMGDPHADSELIWQVNSQAATQAQAETMADAARAALLSSAAHDGVVVDGRAVTAVTSEIPAGAARQDPDQPATWWSFEQFRLTTTPI